jgi:O-antigen/teichoic acid export membrane protein
MNVEAPLDLETPEGRAAYRKELRGVARWPRIIGFGLILIAAVAILNMRSDPEAGAALYGAYAMLAAGWAVLIWSYVQRNIYHRRRTRQSGNDHAGG